MIYIEELNTVFLMPMKCGTTALLQVLKKNYQTRRVGTSNSKHPHSVVRDAKYDDCTYVLCVRNPIIRFLSLWSMYERHRFAWERGSTLGPDNPVGDSPTGFTTSFGVELFKSTPRIQDVLEVAEDSKVARLMRGSWSINHQLQATKTGKPDYVIRQETLEYNTNNFLNSKGHNSLHIPRVRVNDRRKPFTRSEILAAEQIALRWWREDFSIGGYDVT